MSRDRLRAALSIRNIWTLPLPQEPFFLMRSIEIERYFVQVLDELLLPVVEHVRRLAFMSEKRFVLLAEECSDGNESIGVRARRIIEQHVLALVRFEAFVEVFREVVREQRESVRSKSGDGDRVVFCDETGKTPVLPSERRPANFLAWQATPGDDRINDGTVWMNRPGPRAGASVGELRFD